MVLSIVPPLSITTAVYQKKLIRTQRLARKTNSKITAGFSEGIAGVRTTKAFVREEENLKEFQSLTGEMFSYSLENSLHGGRSGPQKKEQWEIGPERPDRPIAITAVLLRRNIARGQSELSWRR